MNLMPLVLVIEDEDAICNFITAEFKRLSDHENRYWKGGTFYGCLLLTGYHTA